MALFTEIFQITPSQIVRNRLFHTFSYLVFGGKYSPEDIKLKSMFLIGKRYLYEDILEGDFDTHIRMKRSVFCGTNRI